MRGHSRCVNSFFSCPYIFTSRHVTEKAEFPQMTAKMVSFLRLPLAAKSTTQNKHTRILTPLVWGTRACVYSSVSLIFHFQPPPTFQVYLARYSIRGFTLELLPPNFFRKRLLQTEIFLHHQRMKSVPLAHVLCELHVEENKTFDDALISFEC